MTAIMIVTAQRDYTADLIVSELSRRGTPVLRLDPAALEPVCLDARLTPSGWEGTIGQGGRSAALGDIQSVLWRWAWAPPGHNAIRDPAGRAWAAKEDAAGIFGVLKTLPARWVNHPDRSGISKAAQLVTAQNVGFATPGTLITRDGTSAARWAATTARQQGLLYKAFFCQGIGEGGMVPATRIDPDRLPEGDLYAASTFQHVIEGQAVRVTVVGERIFAAAIESADQQLDWRPSQQSARMAPVSVPAETAMRLRLFMEGPDYSTGASTSSLIPSANGGSWKSTPAASTASSRSRPGYPSPPPSPIFCASQRPEWHSGRHDDYVPDKADIRYPLAQSVVP